MTNKNIKQQFILTLDKTVKDRLLSQNFTLISEANDKFVFINDGLLTFDNDEDKDILTKMAYTNILCF